MFQNEILQDLIDQRQRLLSSDIEWDDNGASALLELEKIQSQILTVDLSADRPYALAMRLLMEGDDEPNFTDQFKNDLFRRLRHAGSPYRTIT